MCCLYVDVCRAQTGEQCEPPPFLTRALMALRERPALLQVALTELSNARHAAVVRAFIDALTRAKGPMEMYAHDPLRYCGDMLAWVHQAVASEKELFTGLLQLRKVGCGFMLVYV